MPMRFDRRGCASLVALVACLLSVGQAQASPKSSAADRARLVAASSVAQARCYGRYVAWRDALFGTIQQTDSWLTSTEPVAEFDRMQASFVASLSNERGMTLRFSPDLDETALPADIRSAYDRGVQETGAELDAASFHARKSQALDDPARPAAQRMAKLQAAIDDSFAGLRAPCERLVDKRRVVLAPARDEPKRVVAAAPPPPAAEDAAAGLSANWPASQWLQVGVFQRDDPAGETLRSLQSQMPDETTGLSERTEAVDHGGEVQHIALVGPFISGPQAQTFCDKLKAKGGTCSIRLTSTLGAPRKPSAGAKLAKARVSGARAAAHAPAPAHRVLAQATPRRPLPGPLVRASLSSHQSLQAGLRGRLTE
jgi:hypothetical protein